MRHKVTLSVVNQRIIRFGAVNISNLILPHGLWLRQNLWEFSLPCNVMRSLPPLFLYHFVIAQIWRTSLMIRPLNCPELLQSLKRWPVRLLADTTQRVWVRKIRVYLRHSLLFLLTGIKIIDYHHVIHLLKRFFLCLLANPKPFRLLVILLP